MSGLAVNVYRTAAHEQPPCRFMKTSGVSKCVWRPRVLLRLVADRFDIVAVGIRHERGVVGGVVVGPEPGPAIVLPARGHGGGVERVHRRPVLRREGDVRRPAGPALPQPEGRRPLRPEAPPGPALVLPGNPDRPPATREASPAHRQAL